MSKTQSEMKMTITALENISVGALDRHKILFLPVQSQVVGGTLIKAKGVALIRGPDTNDGPFLFGVSTGNLTELQIEEAMNIEGPSGPTHAKATEWSTRWQHIRVIGVLSKNTLSSDPGTFILEYEKVVKMGWAEQDGGYKYWLFNMGDLQVTGAEWDVNFQDFVIYDRD